MRSIVIGLAAMIGIVGAATLFMGGSLTSLLAENDSIQAERPPGAKHIPSAQVVSQPRRPPAETFARVFEPCAHCHQIGDGARTSSGPVLTGVVGRPAASTDFPYSQAMRKSSLTWDEPTLRRFLANPSKVVPGTRMIFKGLSDDKMDQMIDFLKHPAVDATN